VQPSSPRSGHLKDALSNECVDLPQNEQKVVSITSVGAPRHPPTVHDTATERKVIQDSRRLEELREKIQLIFRMAAHNGKTVMGVGCYGVWKLQVSSTSSRGEDEESN
jgi:hypothetical protein